MQHFPFAVRNTTISPGERNIHEFNGASVGDFTAPMGGRCATGPNRLAQYQQNWSGSSYWQTWDVLEYPLEYRPYITGQNANQAALLMIARNPANRNSPAPIALQDYALSTQQVYQGVNPYGY